MTLSANTVQQVAQSLLRWAGRRFSIYVYNQCEVAISSLLSLSVKHDQNPHAVCDAIHDLGLFEIPCTIDVGRPI